MGEALTIYGNMLDSIKLTVTRRDLVLMNLCLDVVAHNYARGGAVRSDIESLQTRLAQHRVAPHASQGGQAG